MTQLTKREQIALELLTASAYLKPDESVNDIIEFSVSAADKFLKHLAETEPLVMTKEDEEFKARLKADIGLSHLLNKEAENNIADHVEKAVNGLNEEKSERVYDLYIKQDLKDFHLDSFRARKAKESNADSPDSRPMNAEEIADWVYENTTLSDSENILLKENINALVDHKVNTALSKIRVSPKANVNSENLIVFSVSRFETVDSVISRMKNLTGFQLKNIHVDGPPLQIFEIERKLKRGLVGGSLIVKYGFINRRNQKVEETAEFTVGADKDVFLDKYTRSVQQHFIHFEA